MSRRTANPRPKRNAGRAAIPAETRRELASPDAQEVLQEAEAELAADLERAATMQDTALATLRAVRRQASSLMIAICRMEGLEPATVAAAILPAPILIHVSDGHPWLPTGSSGHQRLAGRPDPVPASRWRDRVVVRQGSDHRGSLAFVQRRGTIEVEARIGRSWIETHAGTAIITLQERLPETIVTAMPGRPVSQLIDHPLLGDPAYVALSASSTRAGVQIAFHCPDVACVDWDADGGGPPYLHSDPALPPWLAMLDAVRRARYARGRTSTASPAVELLLAREHVRQVNLSRPPEHHLPAPTAQVVAWLSGRWPVEAA